MAAPQIQLYAVDAHYVCPECGRKNEPQDRHEARCPNCERPWPAICISYNCNRITEPVRTEDPELSVLGWTDPVGECHKCEEGNELRRRALASERVPAQIRRNVATYNRNHHPRKALDKALHEWVSGGCVSSVCAYGAAGIGKRTAIGAAAYSVLRKGIIRDAWWLGGDELLEAAQTVWEKGNPMPRQLLRKCEKVGLLVVINMFQLGGAEYRMAVKGVSPAGKEIGQVLSYRLDRNKPTLITSPVFPHWEIWGDAFRKTWVQHGRSVEVK
jgi:hypothetical protein